ncbi:hypothetical protein [Vibrio sp. 1F279]
MKIDITTETYQRLSELVQGFDSPDAVINRLIDEVTKQPKEKPIVIFNPSNEEKFKGELLSTKLAEVCLHYTNTTPLFFPWNAQKLKDTSNLKANLWSGFLRDWKKKGITKIELTVLSNDADMEMLKLAHALGLSYADAMKIQPRSHRENDDYYLIWFENEDMEILNKIVHKKVDNDLNFYLPAFMLDN